MFCDAFYQYLFILADLIISLVTKVIAILKAFSPIALVLLNSIPEGSDRTQANASLPEYLRLATDYKYADLRLDSAMMISLPHVDLEECDDEADARPQQRGGLRHCAVCLGRTSLSLCRWQGSPSNILAYTMLSHLSSIRHVARR